MFTFKTLRGETRTLQDVADAIETEGRLGTGQFIGSNGDRCSLGVACDYQLDDLGSEETSYAGWEFLDSFNTTRFFKAGIVGLNDDLRKSNSLEYNDPKTQQIRARLMASVFRQLAWLDEKGELIFNE